jgi:hypothetical protein
VRLVLALTVCGCSGEELCVERSVTIEQGAYGRLTYMSDVGGSEREPQRQTQVNVITPSNVNFVTISDDDGIYELTLPDGDYSLCFTECEAFKIEGSVVRVDFFGAFVGSHWSVVPRSTCAE